MSPKSEKKGGRKRSKSTTSMTSRSSQVFALPRSGSIHGTSEDDRINLKPKITLVNATTMIIGSIIGSGIFVSPTGVLKEVGSVGVSLIIWLGGGLFSMVGSYCYAELGTMITHSGGDYIYFLEAYGPFLAFLRIWVENIIIRPCTMAIVALTFSYYVVEPLYVGCDQPDYLLVILAIIAMSKYISDKKGTGLLTHCLTANCRYM